MSHDVDVILLAFDDIERHTSMGLFPLNIYHRVPDKTPRSVNNYLPGYGSPNEESSVIVTSLTL